MKNIFISAIAGITLLLSTSCQKEPNASFTVSKPKFTAGETVNFYNNSDDAKSFEWDFGDGTNSTEEDPSKIYDKSGVYTVQLRAFSKNKKKWNEERQVFTVSEAPFAGVRNVEGSSNILECKSGYSDYRSGTSNYNLVIKKGGADNEIIIDNLGNLGINGVRCTVTSFSFFGMEEYEFSIVPGQTLIDKDGRTWKYDAGDVTGDFDNMSNCRTFYIDLRRSDLCGGSTIDFTFTENISDCN